VGVTMDATITDTADLRTAVAAFYDRTIDEIYRYFHRATAGDRRLTEDLTQETFMACVRAAGEGVADALTMPWLMGVARHKLVDHYRRKSRDERRLMLAWTARPIEGGESVFDLTGDDVLSMLSKLSDLHRLVLVLRYVDDLPVSDVAREIGRSVHATESLLVRARQSLEQLVKGTDHG
jgi:RNA polymerase sigma-70 factor (ECF subfamily)